MKTLITSLAVLHFTFLGAVSALTDEPRGKSNYPTAEVWIQHANKTPAEKIHIDNPEKVAELAAYFPGILAARGTGPRKSVGMQGNVTILFHHESGDIAKLRVAHLTADLAYWRWRDNPPFTGDRPVENIGSLRKLLETLDARQDSAKQ